MLLPFYDIWHQTLLNIFQYIQIYIVNKCRKSISLGRQVKCSPKPSHQTLFFAENDVYVFYHFTGTATSFSNRSGAISNSRFLKTRYEPSIFLFSIKVEMCIDWLIVCVYIVQTYRIIFYSEPFSVERRIEFNIYSDFIALNVNIKWTAKGWWNHQ